MIKGTKIRLNLIVYIIKLNLKIINFKMKSNILKQKKKKTTTLYNPIKLMN